MGLFDFMKPKRDGDAILIDLIEHNADRIVEAEGKDRKEAIYLAICMVFDDLSNRPNGQEGQQAVMHVLQDRYPDQFNEVITYIAWSTRQIVIKPEYEAELIARHQ